MDYLTVLRVVSVGIILGGVGIGIACAPFMWSASIVDVTGAGLGCITAAILITGGLRALVTLGEPRTASRHPVSAGME